MLLVPAETSDGSLGASVLFDALVKAGEEKLHAALPDHLHTFLVQCLTDHFQDPEIVFQVLALGFLDLGDTPGAQRVAALKRYGDASLILAGLFPERALRLRVSGSYFREMGQSFYSSLAAYLEVTAAYERGRLYNEVAREFEFLEQVLHGSRGSPQDDWQAFQGFYLKLQS